MTTNKVLGPASREYFLDFLRIVACVFIITRHVVDSTLHYGSSNMHQWHIGVVYNSLTYVALQLFIMITGYLLLGKVETYLTFFNKRFSRILLPFLFWSAAYWLYDGGKINWDFFSTFLTKPLYYHLWYVYFIVGVYLALPFLRRAVQNMQEQDWQVLLGLWILFSTIFTAFDGKFSYAPGVSYLFQGWWGFLFLGYYLKTKEITRQQSYALLFLFAASYVLNVVGIVYGGEKHPLLFNLLNPTSPTIIVMSTSLFLLAKRYITTLENYLSAGMKRLIVHASGLTFAVYLSHALVLDILMKGTLGYKVDTTAGNTWLAIPGVALLVFAICLIGLWIISYLPILKRCFV